MGPKPKEEWAGDAATLAPLPKPYGEGRHL